MCVVHKRCHEMIITRCPGVPVNTSKPSIWLSWKETSSKDSEDLPWPNTNFLFSGRQAGWGQLWIQDQRAAQVTSCCCCCCFSTSDILSSSRFDNHNYMKFTWCDHCGSLLYGLTKQGLQCKGRSHLWLNFNLHGLFQCARWMCTSGART